MANRRRRRAQDARDLLGEAEVQRLLMACSERAPTGVRNRALIALLYCSGLRVGEALRLRVGDVDLDAENVAVRGRRPRAAHLFPAARPYLETWLALRARLGLPAAGELFSTLRGAPLAGAYVRALLTRLAARAGVGKRVHAHLLRHSCAARLAASGLAAEALAAQLGHGEPRAARRALAAFGIGAPRTGTRHAAEVRWSLAPEPGAVRALLVSGTRAPRVRAASGGGVVIRRWRPEEL